MTKTMTKTGMCAALSLMLMGCAALDQRIYEDNFAYSDSNHDGRLNRDEWAIYMQDRSVKTAKAVGYSDKALFDHKLFIKVDADHDGTVSKKEYDQFILQGNTNEYYKNMP